MKHLIKFNESDSESTLPYRFSIYTGDPGGDGHGKYDRHIIASNLPNDVVKALYREAVETTGIDIRDYCNDYEDHSFPSDASEKLIAYGIDLEEALGKWEYQELIGEERVSDPETMIRLIMAMVKSQDDSFEYKFVGDNVPNLGLDCGYGLYY